MPPVIETYLQVWIAGAIVLLGLVVYGFGDLLRFSFKRAWAISRVVFAEAIRRRVLWITPLVIVAVVLVSQFQKPLDEQDAIRQTIKFSLFATGLLVTVTAIILACTNLPKEIETRVIYTVVTKPITRLEIVVGKVMGFAKVSLTILLIMGLFTFGYLHLRAWNLRRDINQRLAMGAIEPLSRPTYEYWAKEGLLTSRTLEQPDDLQILSRAPAANETRRWFYGGQGDAIVPFALSEADLVPQGVPNAQPGAAGVLVRVMVGYQSNAAAGAAAEEGSLQIGVTAPAQVPTTQSQKRAETASISIQILDANQNLLIGGDKINQGKPLMLSDPSGNTPVAAYIEPDAAPNLLRTPVIYVAIVGLSEQMEYSVETRPEASPLNSPACLIVPGDPPESSRVIAPVKVPGTDQFAGLSFRGRLSNYGQQLRGGDPAHSPVAVYRYRGARPTRDQGVIGFEMRAAIERSGTETEEDVEPTRVSVVAIDRASGVASEPVYINPESNRTCYFSLPAAALPSGNFDLCLRSLSEGHYLSLGTISLSMVASQESFNTNLAKSLAILWLLSVLVVITSIFCSMFLSWPIATVLTLVILLGHWGVMQLGDALAPGIGHQVVQDIFGSDQGQAGKAEVVSRSVEAMAKMLNGFAPLLPDITRFSAIEDIERGVTVSAQKLIQPLGVLAGFGVPMLVLSYIFLRNKEVAP